jgi:hypothetical protein
MVGVGRRGSFAAVSADPGFCFAMAFGIAFLDQRDTEGLSRNGWNLNLCNDGVLRGTA